MVVSEEGCYEETQVCYVVVLDLSKVDAPLVGEVEAFVVQTRVRRFFINSQESCIRARHHNFIKIWLIRIDEGL